MASKDISYFPAKLDAETKRKAERVAKANRRGLSVELGILVEKGLRSVLSERGRKAPGASE